MKTTLYFPSVLFAAVTLLAGCHTAHDVAVTSFHVIDAPANYVRRHIDDQPTTTTTSTTTTTTAYQSDVANPGRPLASASSTPRTTVHHETSPATETSRTASTSPSATSQKATAKFPVAKAVAGKAGYVYSPFDPSGGYVDVTGYTSGSKVKDPYSGKIFIVP